MIPIDELVCCMRDPVRCTLNVIRQGADIIDSQSHKIAVLERMVSTQNHNDAATIRDAQARQDRLEEELGRLRTANDRLIAEVNQLRRKQT